MYHIVDPDPSFMCDLFDKLITPILMYASEVWGFHKADAIERVHTIFCKKVLHVRKNSCNSIVYGELGRQPLQTLRLYRIIKYWLKIVTCKSNKLVSDVYNLMYRNSDIMARWASLVKLLASIMSG